MEMTFDENSTDYSQVRPGYPNEMYKHISKYKLFTQKSKLLDIGAGDGIATNEINNIWHPCITAIEPGESLYNLGNKRFHNMKNINYIHSTFENYKTTNKYDGIYAATAFHWLDPKSKFEKNYRLLKDDGILFLFWNYFNIAKDDVFNDIQSIYKEFHPNGIGKQDVRTLMRSKIDERRIEIEKSKYFSLVNYKEFKYNTTFNAERYIKLLRTFPINNHDKITPFYKAIKNYIINKNNELELQIIVALNIGKKNNRSKLCI